MVMASIQIIIFRICTLSNDLCVRSYISCSIPSSRTVLFSLIISSLTPGFILSISLISHLVILSRPVLTLIPFPLSSGYASRLCLVLSRSVLRLSTFHVRYSIFSFVFAATAPHPGNFLFYHIALFFSSECYSTLDLLVSD